MADRSSASLRPAIKSAMPAPVVQALSFAVNYVRRLAAWRRVLRDVRGRTPADAAVLRRAALRAPLDMFADLGAWREPALPADAEVVVNGLGTFAIRGQSDDLGHVLPDNFAAIAKIIGERVRPGDVVIDAGANMGAVAILTARRVGETGAVIAVEMMPDTAARLRRNIALNGLTNVRVVEQALSDKAGERVVAHVAAGVFGQASIAAGHRGRSTDRQVTVTTTTLDDLTAELGEITLMKMDLEGAEPLALGGAAETLKRVRAIIFESWQGDGGQAAAILRASGFEIAPVDGRNFLARPLMAGR